MNPIKLLHKTNTDIAMQHLMSMHTYMYRKHYNMIQ